MGLFIRFIFHFLALTSISFAADVKSLDHEVAQIFKDPKFNQTYLTNGCQVRAHWIAEKIRRQGFRTFKIFLFAADPQQKISITSPRFNQPMKWVYHVAVATWLQNKVHVVDPFFSEKNIPYEMWINFFKLENPDLKIRLYSNQVYKWTGFDDQGLALMDSFPVAFGPEARDQVAYDMEDLFIWEKSALAQP